MGSIFGGGSKVEAPPFQRIDVRELDELAREIARRNAEESIALEAELRPELAQLRDATYSTILGDLLGYDRQGIQQSVQQQMMQQLNRPDQTISAPELERSALLQSAIDRAQTDLGLGARLPQDVANQVTRQAGERGGRMGLTGTGTGRDVVARDLGLSSLDLLNQRMQQAAGLGQVEQQINLGQQSLADSINRFNVQSGMQQQQQRAQAGSFLQGLIDNPVLRAQQTTMGTAMPMVGLDPGQAASFQVADINALNQYNQQLAAAQAQAKQANSGFWGDLIGAGLGAAGTALGGPLGGVLATSLWGAASK